MNNYLIVKEDRRFFSLVTREIVFDDSKYELIQTELEPNNGTDIWNGSEWVDNTVIVVPQEISRMKFKIQIRRSTIYSYDIILTYIQNLAVTELFTQDDKDQLIDRLEDAVSFNRYHNDFINLANMLSVPDEIKDEIFIEGNKIV